MPKIYYCPPQVRYYGCPVGFFPFFSRSGIAHPLQAIKTHANSAKITPTKRPASHIDTTMAPPSRRSSPRKHEVKKATAGRTGRLTKSPARGGKRGSSPPKAAKARKYPDLTPTQISTHQHAFYAAVAQEDEGKAANSKLMTQAQYTRICRVLMSTRRAGNVTDIRNDGHPSAHHWVREYALLRPVPESEMPSVEGALVRREDKKPLKQCKLVCHQDVLYDALYEEHKHHHSRGQGLFNMVRQFWSNIPRTYCQMFSDTCPICTERRTSRGVGLKSPPEDMKVDAPSGSAQKPAAATVQGQRQMEDDSNSPQWSVMWNRLAAGPSPDPSSKDTLYSFVDGLGNKGQVLKAGDINEAEWDTSEWNWQDPMQLPYGISDGPDNPTLSFARHNMFNSVLLVNIGFLSEDFFCPHSHIRINNIYNGFKDPATAKSHELSGTDGAMLYQPLYEKSDSVEKKAMFKFAGSRYKDQTDHKVFLRSMEMVLENEAGKPKPGEKDYVDLSETELDVSFIETVREKPMKIHTDLNHSAARKHHADGKELPYTIDLPMSGDGIRIGIYGDDPLDTTEKFDEAIKNNTIKREAVVVTCPPKHAILWPARTIHCGGYRGPKGSSAFRMHLHAPLFKDHKGCGFNQETLACLPRVNDDIPMNTPAYTTKLTQDAGSGEYAWDKLHFVKAGEEDSAIDSGVLKYILSQPPYLRTAAEASAGGNV